MACQSKLSCWGGGGGIEVGWAGVSQLSTTVTDTWDKLCGEIKSSPERAVFVLIRSFITLGEWLDFIMSLDGRHMGRMRLRSPRLVSKRGRGWSSTPNPCYPWDFLLDQCFSAHRGQTSGVLHIRHLHYASWQQQNYSYEIATKDLRGWEMPQYEKRYWRVAALGKSRTTELDLIS